MSHPRLFNVVVAVAVVSFAALILRSTQFDVATPDGSFWYDAGHLGNFFCQGDPLPKPCVGLLDCWRNIGPLRRLYIVTQVTFDTLFPLAYGTLLGILTVRYYSASKAKWLILFPLLTIALDLTENTMLVRLALFWECGSSPPPLAKIVPWVSSAKWSLLGLSGVAVIAGRLHQWLSPTSP